MPDTQRTRLEAEPVGEPSHMGLGLIGMVVAALCCIAVPLALSAGGAGLTAFAAGLDYAWIAIPILLAGLAAYLLWRRFAQWTDRTEGHHR